MKQKGFEMHYYNDDYIAVISREKADFAFATLCDILNELGLPITESKLPPPPPGPGFTIGLKQKIVITLREKS